MADNDEFQIPSPLGFSLNKYPVVLSTYVESADTGLRKVAAIITPPCAAIELGKRSIRISNDGLAVLIPFDYGPDFLNLCEEIMKQENINIQSVKIQSLRQAYVELGQCGSIVLQLPFSISKSYNLMRVTRPSGIYYILSFEEVHTGETVNDIKV